MSDNEKKAIANVNEQMAGLDKIIEAAAQAGVQLQQKPRQVNVKVGSGEGKVLIHFGDPIAWFGLDVNEAIRFMGMIAQQVKILTEAEHGNNPDGSKDAGENSAGGDQPDSAGGNGDNN